MKTETLLALANLITVFAKNECGESFTTAIVTVPAGDAPAGDAPVGDTPAPPVKRRGRPPGTTTPSKEDATLGTANAVEHLKNVAAEPEKEKPAEEQPVTGGKTIDDMRAFIEPLIKATRGAEVKAVIKKYAPTLIQMDPKDYPAFEKDIEALLY